VTIDATKLSSLNIPVFNIAGLAQYDPSQVALEVAHESDARTVAFGATYKLWSRYKGPIEPTISCPPGEEGCGALVPAVIGYANTLVVREGWWRALFVPAIRASLRSATRRALTRAKRLIEAQNAQGSLQRDHE
jgi:long-chain fatty acid transport protein